MESDLTPLEEKEQRLYKLNEINRDPSKIAKLGPLPAESVALITVLSASWISLGAFYAVRIVKKRKQR